MNLYVYGKGSCRGERFSINATFDTAGVTKDLDTAINLKQAGDEDGYAEFIDTIYTEYTDEGHSQDYVSIITGSDCIPYEFNNLNKMIERRDAIVKGESFTIFNEESTMGVGSSKDQAIIAFATSDD